MYTERGCSRSAVRTKIRVEMELGSILSEELFGKMELKVNHKVLSRIEIRVKLV